MRKLYVFIFIIFIITRSVTALGAVKIDPSFYKLTTSNGLIVAVYDYQKNIIEYVCPHIFALYDSALYVRPFAGNIKLEGTEESPVTYYNKNTHVITAQYHKFTLNYFASFTENEKIFYIAARGPKEEIEKLSFSSEAGNNKILTGISLLTNSHDDLTVHLGGNLLSGNILRKYTNSDYERYFLFSFTDSLHKDSEIITRAINRIKKEKRSLLDAELEYMSDLFQRCRIPVKIPARERAIVEQSISFFKMAQVSDNEIFPYSRGQVLAALRPGLWHSSWVRDGSYAIQAMTALGMYSEAKKFLEFMLKAPSGRYKHYIHTDGKDYGVKSEYQISICRYYGNGKEESTYVDGPNIEYDNFGLFLWAYSDYILKSGDKIFYEKWKELVMKKAADVTVSVIDTNSLIREDSGPWEHYLQMPKQYTFTSGACAEGLKHYAMLQKKYGNAYRKYETAAETLKKGLLDNMLVDKRYFKGNSKNKNKDEYEYYDAGVFEIFANGLIDQKKLFHSHMEEYDKVLRMPGERRGYIRLSSNDPYENQEWVFINLRIALAHLLFGEREKAGELIDYVTSQAASNNNTIPEMFSNKVQSGKVTEYFKSHDVWCNCIRDKDGLYIGAIPMVGYGSGAYVLTLLEYYKEE